MIKYKQIGINKIKNIIVLTSWGHKYAQVIGHGYTQSLKLDN